MDAPKSPPETDPAPPATRVTLTRPIEAHGERVSVLEFREPTLAALDDIRLAVDRDGSLQVNLGDLHRFVSAAAGIPPSAARTIHLADLAPIGRLVLGFIGASPSTGGS